MFWNKKGDKRSLPDLPPMKRPIFTSGQDKLDLGVFPTKEIEVDEERHELPSFPDSMHDNSFSQAAIKDAIGESEESEPEFPETNNYNPGVVEMEEWHPSMPLQRDRMMRSPPMYSRPQNIVPPKPINFDKIGGQVKNEDIFVKLDKFYSARKALLDAQQKVGEIDDLLRKIRETKMREEQELSVWENDLMAIKARMNDVTVNLFEKVD